MAEKKNGRSDEATPERPAEEGSFEGDQLQPHFNDTTSAAHGQEKLAWCLEDETRLVDYIISPYIRPSCRRRSKYRRYQAYNEAMKEVNSYPLSADANLYARKTLAKWLKL